MYFQRIEDLRIDHDYTQKQVAQHLGIAREVYRRYEKGNPFHSSRLSYQTG